MLVIRRRLSSYTNERQVRIIDTSYLPYSSYSYAI